MLDVGDLAHRRLHAHLAIGGNGNVEAAEKLAEVCRLNHGSPARRGELSLAVTVATHRSIYVLADLRRNVGIIVHEGNDDVGFAVGLVAILELRRVLVDSGNGVSDR